MDGEVHLKDINSDAVQVDAKTSKPALLVVTDNYSRDWKATPLGASGQSSYRVMPVYGFLRGIPLMAGEHHILLEYRPTAYGVGKWISIVSWIVFLGFLSLQGWTNSRQKASSFAT